MENRACVGVAKFNSASLNQPKMEQMKTLLRTNCGILLEGVIAEEAQFRSIALQVCFLYVLSVFCICISVNSVSLQIQWLVININTHFMLDHGLTQQSPPQCKRN